LIFFGQARSLSLKLRVFTRVGSTPLPANIRLECK
jgi:hypothetical protein